MLDKIIHSHLDNMDEIEIEIEKDIEELISTISIESIMENPEAELLQVVSMLSNIIENKYAHLAIDEGLNIADRIKIMIEKDRKIIIDDSTNPNKNESLFDDRSKD